MFQCSNCGHHLLGGEARCPACGQPTPFSSPRHDFSPPRIPQSLPLGNYIKVGWELFKHYPCGFIAFCLLNICINVILNTIPFLGPCASLALTPSLVMGNFIVAARLLQGQTPQFGDFFSAFSCFWPLLLVSLISSILIAIGMALLIIPGVYLIVGYLFASCLVVDRALDFWPAMELSRRTVTPLWFGFFAFVLLLTVMNLAGALLLGLGLLATIPISFCALTVAYDDLYGFQSDYTQGVQRLKTL
jgi:hypothetical protein